MAKTPSGMLEIMVDKFLDSDTTDGGDISIDKLLKMAKIENYQGKSSASRGTKRQRKTVKEAETQTEIEVANLADECVKNWLFISAPEAIPQPELEISEMTESNVYSDDKYSIADDGSFQDDPIMRLWRTKIAKIKKHI